MKLWVLPILLLAAALARAEVKLEVIAGNASIGTATMEQKLLPNGSKQVSVTMELQPPGGVKTIIRQESIYSPSGMPVRLIQETSIPSLKQRERAVARIDGDTVELEFTEGGNTRKERRTIDKSLPRRVSSEFWFIRDRPAPGKQETAYRFHLSELKWEPQSVTYRGRTEIEIAGEKVSAHRIDATEGTYYVDDNGDPWLIEVDRVTMRRIVPKGEQR